MAITAGEAGKGAVTILQSIDDMYQIGRAIGAENPCDPVEIIITLTELVIELIWDFITGLIKLAGIAGKNSIFLILAILQETYGPSILLGITGTLGFLGGNLIGTLLQGMALVLAQVDGIKMILMYLAAGAAMSAVVQRQGFIHMYMMNAIHHIIHVLQLLDQLQYTFDDPYAEDYADIRNAYTKVRDASLILGVEVDRRIADGSAYLDVGAIETVRALLHEAIDLLLGGKYDIMLNQVTAALGGLDISQSLNLQFSGDGDGASWSVGNYSANWSQAGVDSAASFGTINSLNDYYSLLGALGKSLYNVDHSDQPLSGNVTFDLEEGSWDNTTAGQGSAAIKQLLDDMIFQLDPVFQAISYIHLVKVDLGQLVDKTPLRNSQFTKFFDIIEDVIRENQTISTSDFTSYASITAPEGGASMMDNLVGSLANEQLVTLQSVNNKCRMTQSALTMLNFNLASIQVGSGLIELMVRPIFALLSDVRTDMRDFLNQTGHDTRSGAAVLAGLGVVEDGSGGFTQEGFGSQMWDVGTQKITWATKLEVVKSSLMSFTTTISVPGGEPVNWMDSSLAEQVEVKWDLLVAYLENTGGDVWMSPDREGLQPADVAFEMMQEIPAAVFLDLGGITLGDGIIGRGESTVSKMNNQWAGQIMPDINQIAAGEPARGLLLAYMQDLKTQFRLQFGIDQFVHSSCHGIRTLIEQHPGFQHMMSWWAGLTNSLADGPLAMLGPEMAEGSLDTLASAVSNTATMLENPLYRNLGPCIKSGIVPASTIALGIGLDPVQIPAVEAELAAEKAVAKAKDLQEQLLQGFTNVTTNAEWEEFLVRKRELMINMQNQAAQLQDTVTQLATIYAIVGGA